MIITATGKELAEGSSDEAAVVDYTKIPVEMEKKFGEFDESNALRPTIINPSDDWRMSFQKTLLSEPEEKSVDVDVWASSYLKLATNLVQEQEKERNKAFDLLDALTKSGVLPVQHAALHVVIASTHCFDKSIIDTVIQVYPICCATNSYHFPGQR